MRLVTVVSIIAACLCGCSTHSCFITERDARLISIARTAAAAEGFSLTDAIYQVRRDGDGWLIVVNKAPGYTGTGELSVVFDGTFFVRLTAEEKVQEIGGHGHSVKYSTSPTDLSR